MDLKLEHIKQFFAAHEYFEKVTEAQWYAQVNYGDPNRVQFVIQKETFHNNITRYNYWDYVQQFSVMVKDLLEFKDLLRRANERDTQSGD